MALVNPHGGGDLKPLLLAGDELAAEQKRAASLPRLRVSSRERGDILFPEDGYVSGLHCQLAVNQGRLTVTDVGSSNGSYVRLHGPRAVRNGDFLLLGQQLFRVHTL